MSAVSEPPADAWVVALLALPGLGPNRLSQLTNACDARAAWKALCDGGAVSVAGVRSSTVEKWRVCARLMSVADHWDAIQSLGIAVATHHGPNYPERLSNDPEPPQALFCLGQPGSLLSGSIPTVGIVGTRECTSYGRRCAFELAAALTSAGVSVISGLALGIDAAAHQGALSVPEAGAAPPIGVVGSGLDVIYPKQNAGLWANVAKRGVLLSETPPGVGPERWRFPARNRIIAGLSDAVLVVESHAQGGSLLTVDEAQLRDVPVGVVPGPITSNAAVGTNRLLADGATPILGVEDVLALIGYTPLHVVDGSDPTSAPCVLLDVLGWTPQSLDQICSRVDLSTAEVAAEIQRLISEGLCVQNGVWIERVR